LDGRSVEEPAGWPDQGLVARVLEQDETGVLRPRSNHLSQTTPIFQIGLKPPQIRSRRWLAEEFYDLRRLALAQLADHLARGHNADQGQKDSDQADLLSAACRH